MELLHSLLFMLNEMSPYILLGFLIAGLMHAFIPQKTFAHHLSGTGLSAVIKSALIGIPLPLCSCGVLPTAIAMRRNGASRAASTSFLVSTPQTGVDSIAATWSLLGPAFALIRPIAALVTAVFGGMAVGKAERHEAAPIGCTASETSERADKSFGRKCLDALRYGYIDLVGSIGGWLVAGLVIAALITVYVPADFFSVLGSKPIFSMIAVLIIAIPMYVCATGSIPIALSLMLKGLSPGTALVLLMAGPAANFASFTLISREMGRKSAVIYLASIIIGAIAFGLTIDYLLPAEWFRINNGQNVIGHEHDFALFPTVCSAILVALLVFTFIKGHKQNHITISDMTKEYTIKGMNCSHCQASVTKAIASVEGVEQVEVNLSTGKAVVKGEHNAQDIVAAVRNAGFDVIA
ncbi:MAG: SO_0444 family Cu/Zn efflux transporter [Bacteroides cellulosilyticus]|nr:SO_0444 family Cu/Zn efflux transporter [Bacteroides cellulosilyticus]